MKAKTLQVSYIVFTSISLFIFVLNLTGCTNNQNKVVGSSSSFAYITTKTNLNAADFNIINPQSIDDTIPNNVIGIDGDLLPDEPVKKMLIDKLENGATLVIIDKKMTEKDIYNYLDIDNSDSSSIDPQSSGSLQTVGLAVYKDQEGIYKNVIIRAEDQNDATILRVLSDIATQKSQQKSILKL